MVCVCACECAQSVLALCDFMDCSPPGSSVYGIFQARILEWAAMPAFRVSSPPRDRTCISCVSWIGRQILYQLCHLGSPKIHVSYYLRYMSLKIHVSYYCLFLFYIPVRVAWYSFQLCVYQNYIIYEFLFGILKWTWQMFVRKKGYRIW